MNRDYRGSRDRERVDFPLYVIEDDGSLSVISLPEELSRYEPADFPGHGTPTTGIFAFDSQYRAVDVEDTGYFHGSSATLNLAPIWTAEASKQRFHALLVTACHFRDDETESEEALSSLSVEMLIQKLLTSTQGAITPCSAKVSSVTFKQVLLRLLGGRRANE